MEGVKSGGGMHVGFSPIPLMGKSFHLLIRWLLFIHLIEMRIFATYDLDDFDERDAVASLAK
jgi:hypothetical protein